MKLNWRELGREIVGMLADWRLALLLGIYLALTLLLMQTPLAYSFMAGTERGPQSDLPFLQNFHAPEVGENGQRWRWSRAEAAIEVPAIGERPTILGLNIVSHRAQWEPDAPPTVLYLSLNARDPDAAPLPLTLRPERGRYLIYVPEQALNDGGLHLGLQTEGWQNPLDRRENLGVAIGEQVTITSATTGAGGFVWPGWGLLLGWSGGLALLWLSLRTIRLPPWPTLLLLLPVAVLVPLLLLSEAPRVGFGNLWIVQMGLLGLGSALVCLLLVPPLLRWLDVEPPARLLPWLLFLLVLTFALKYSVRLYPESMPGDVQLHVNRTSATIWGQVYIEGKHRGLQFPFPGGPYLMVAPFYLLGGTLHFWFQFLDGLMEVGTVLLLYLLTARFSGSARLGVLAAALYALMPVSHMMTWFAFVTQVAAVFLTTLLIALLVFCWPQRRDWRTWWLVFAVLVLVFVSHIGHLINLTLAGLLLLPLLWWRARNADERQATLWLAGVGLAAALFVSLFYYSAFLGAIVSELAQIASEGMNATTDRPPIPRAETLHVLWHGGLIDHFGFFPALLALGGTLLLARARWRGSLLPPLIWSSFLVSSAQALWPLLTLNSITTRWLTFMTWGVALTCALTLPALWRRGWGGRVVLLAMAGYVCWVTLVVWIDAMALRLPPIEPF